MKEVIRLENLTDQVLDSDEEILLNLDEDLGFDTLSETAEIASGSSTVLKASFNMTKTIVGAGVFGLPNTFQKAGFLTVSFLIVSMAFFINWTLQVLLSAGIKAGVYSYHDLMHKCFGIRGSQLYAFFAFAFAFGGTATLISGMAAYTVIIGDTVPIVIRAIFGVAGETTDLSIFLKILTDRRIVIILSSYLIMLPIASVREISSLAKYSIFALVAIVLIAICVMIAGSYIDPILKGSSEIFTTVKFQGVPGAIGTLCFAYVCHHNTFIIYKSLKHPTFQNFNTVNFFSLSYAMLASLAIGMTGYVIFSDKIKSNILNCFSNTDGLINFARGLFALDMFLTYPLELFIARNTILHYFFENTTGHTDLLHNALTVGLVTMTTLIGVSTCNLGLVLDLTGGIAASAIAFIFPAACTIQLGGGYIYKRDNWIYLTCIGFGGVLLLLTSAVTIVEAFGVEDEGVCKYKNF